jgi:glycosyltransferase involved in cell wall biosynthesis
MRPSVDVVVPFRGSAAELQQLRARLEQLNLEAGDSLLVVDNTPARAGDPDRGTVPVVHAAERRTPGYARNRGVAVGTAEWIVFLDADTEPAADLLDRYFEPPPGDATGLLGGGVRDEPVPGDARPAARYSYIRAAMSQDNTFRFGTWGFPVTANAAVRRAAFETAGGFREDIRAAEDADLAYRLRAAGWLLERRERATVTHLSRETTRSFVAQKAIHGAGGAWLERHYPGSFPARRRPGLTWWGVRTVVRGLVGAAFSRSRDRGLWALFEPAEELAFEFGRSLPNERPLTLKVWLSALRRL